ncbi:MAG TPA: hypothetical protein VG095_04740, partial [Chthoniobacterales bacterium]|nr:hypothetical protein [Chthoniobacterales bacterium]
ERNYSFDYSNAHFVVIDANPFVYKIDPTAQAAIKNSLAADLAATTKLWRFVFFHQPAYTSYGGSTHHPATILQNELQPLFAQYGVQIAFQGHNHFYERINPISAVNYITTGAGGRSLTTPSIFPPYSAVVNSNVYSFTRVDVNGSKLTLRQINASGGVIDSLDLDLHHPFQIDGLLDSPQYERAATPNGLKLYAAVRKDVLYVATQDAGEGSDHFIYLHTQSDVLRAANWTKAGQVMNWSAFLADENENGFKGWFDPAEQLLSDASKYAATTSGLNNNAAAGNGVVEGTIDLRAHFGSFPSQLLIAAAPFASANGGALVSSAQVPAGNGDGDLQANEYLLLDLRQIALDLPTSDAGPDSTVEAGMQVALAGSGSAPSGFPLAFEWSQLSGPAAVLAGTTTPVVTFRTLANVSEPTPAMLRLRVNDTRFDVDDTVTIGVFRMVDTDGDGLSDQEELTGNDNGLTNANPGGKLTDPQQADTDGDGTNDGAEALAGTDPNDARSLFRILAIVRAGSDLQVSFASLPGRSYQLQTASGMSAMWGDVGAPITASGTVTPVTLPAADVQTFLRVRLVLD